MLRFCANVSLLFGEHPFTERFAAARAAGFDAVEFWWPSGEDLDTVVEGVTEAGLEVVLINFDAGDMPAGDRGLLSDPDRHQQFRANVPVALELAGRLGCRKLNALVGTQLPGVSPSEQRALAVDSVRFAAEAAAGRAVSVLIEAVNTFENGPYLLSRTEDASAFVGEVARSNVWLQYDAYHMQRMEGNLVDTFRRYRDRIAHVQIADSPDRHEPGTGEISFGYLLGAIEQSGYDGHIGLEYRPSADTTEGLGWLAAYGGPAGRSSGS